MAMAKRVGSARDEQHLGPEVKRLREQAKLSVRTLAEQSGFSPSFISQLENGQVSPSIQSLGHIAGALGVSLADLFTPRAEPGPAVIKANARPSFHSSWSKAQIAALTPLAMPHSIEALIVTIESGGSSGKHPAGLANEQIAVVFDGRVELTIGADHVELERGDAVFIPARTPHRWHNPADGAAQIVLVATRTSR
jgi:transcriptional regulator with XRE-family HTH domain